MCLIILTVFLELEIVYFKESVFLWELGLLDILPFSHCISMIDGTNVDFLFNYYGYPIYF